MVLLGDRRDVVENVVEYDVYKEQGWIDAFGGLRQKLMIGQKRIDPL